MPAPSKNWTEIADGRVDAESPLDSSLMTALRDNMAHLREWLGVSFSAAQDHDHDGINSKSVVLADSTVTTAKIAGSAVTGVKTSKAASSTGTYTLPSLGAWTPAAGVYQMVDTTTPSLQLDIYAWGDWRRNTGMGASIFGYFDGANMRVYNSNASFNAFLYYQMF